MIVKTIIGDVICQTPGGDTAPGGHGTLAGLKALRRFTWQVPCPRCSMKQLIDQEGGGIGIFGILDSGMN